MNARSLSAGWLAAWLDRVSEALSAMTGDFERRYGFPPGVNEVRPADDADRVSARRFAQVSALPADLGTFYDSVGEVTWEDVGNGYFVASAGDARGLFEQYGAVAVGPDQGTGGLAIGSNGGGLSYVAGPAGGIYRTRTATLDEPELDLAADDLRHFLELLERSLTRFIANGEPGYL